MRVAAIILAAGASRRLGRPKQTVVIGGETLLHSSIRIATESGLSPILVVVATEDLADHATQSGAIAVLNYQAEEGIASSIRVGIMQAKARSVPGVVLMTCDQIAVSPEHLHSLCTEPSTPTGSGYAGKIGIPAYFPASSFEALLKLQGDTGARDLLRSARAIQTEALSFDLDTEEDVTRAEGLFGTLRTTQ